MNTVETTTAWGASQGLDDTLRRIFDRRPGTTHVEIAVGCRPGPVELLHGYPDVVFIGHHVLPLGDRSLRPTTREMDAVVGTLLDAGIRRYTAHPPHRRFMDADGFLGWCTEWLDTLSGHGIEFAVETMYVPRTRQEQAASGGYFLSTPHEVWTFVEWAQGVGWQQPLVLDASHMFIGFQGGAWAHDDVVELLGSGPADEIHVSENDGRRDLHRPLTEAHTVASWCTPEVLDRFRYVVPEGKHPLEGP